MCGCMLWTTVTYPRMIPECVGVCCGPQSLTQEWSLNVWVYVVDHSHLPKNDPWMCGCMLWTTVTYPRMIPECVGVCCEPQSLTQEWSLNVWVYVVDHSHLPKNDPWMCGCMLWTTVTYPRMIPECVGVCCGPQSLTQEWSLNVWVYVVDHSHLPKNDPWMCGCMLWTTVTYPRMIPECVGVCCGPQSLTQEWSLNVWVYVVDHSHLPKNDPWMCGCMLWTTVTYPRMIPECVGVCCGPQSLTQEWSLNVWVYVVDHSHLPKNDPWMCGYMLWTTVTYPRMIPECVGVCCGPQSLTQEWSLNVWVYVVDHSHLPKNDPWMCGCMLWTTVTYPRMIPECVGVCCGPQSLTQEWSLNVWVYVVNHSHLPKNARDLWNSDVGVHPLWRGMAEGNGNVSPSQSCKVIIAGLDPGCSKSWSSSIVSPPPRHLSPAV